LNKYKQLANQTIIYGLGTIVPRMLNFLLLTPFYTNVFLEQEKYGTITELYSYTAFLLVLLTYGMETTFFRFSNKYGNNNIFNVVQSVITVTSVLFISAILFTYNSIAGIIGYANSSYFVLLFCFIVFFDVITSIPFAYLRQINRPIYFSIVKLGNVAINIFFNIFFLVICKNAQSPGLASLYNPEIGVGYAFISNLIASAFVFFALLPVFLKFKFVIRLGIIRHLLSYSMPLVIVGFAGMFNEVADKIFLKYLVPEHLNPLKQVGIYGANYKMAVLMTIFIQMFKYAAEPFFFKSAAQIDAKHTYSTVMTWFVVACLLIFLGVTMYIDLFQYFIGKPYRVGLHIVPIVLLANMFLGIYYNLSVWYKINNLTRFGAIISLVGVVITLFVNVVFIPIYGYIASAWATLICYFSMMLISYQMSKKYYFVKYNAKLLSLYFISAILLYLVKLYLNFDSLVVNNLVSTILFLVFVLIIYLTKKNDLKTIYRSLLK